MTRLRDEIEGGQRFGHHLPSRASVRCAVQKLNPAPIDVIAVDPLTRTRQAARPRFCQPVKLASTSNSELQRNRPRVLQLFGGLAPFEGGVDCDFSETAGLALDEGDTAMFNGGLAEVGIVDEHPESWPAMLTYPLLGPLRSGCEFDRNIGWITEGLSSARFEPGSVSGPAVPSSTVGAP